MMYREYPALDERLYTKVLPNGLPVLVVRRPEFSRKIAYFMTNYGAIHRSFSLDGKQITAPMGVAHFLEHKLFDMPGGRDITAEFAALGADPNAFTSYDLTAYYFSCSENFSACLRLLLEFVSTGYFTAETVEKEQGIIGQEIGMNEDSPDNRVFLNLADAMYREHPIREPILGDADSIARITHTLLEDCHRAFYRPDNMLLCVVGDVDPEEVVRIAEETVPAVPGSAEAVRKWDEPETVTTAYVEQSMEVAMPMFLLGFKCRPAEGGEAVTRQEFIAEIATEALFGEGSDLYLSLYEKGLIDSSFGGGFETLDGVALSSCGGDSPDPAAVRDAILERAAALARTGISREEFLRLKRSAMGRRIRSLDSFDSTCFRLGAYHFTGFDYFAFPAVCESVTQEDVREFLYQNFREDRCCLSVINPIHQEEAL